MDCFTRDILKGKVEKALATVPPGKLKKFLRHQDLDLQTLKKLEEAARDVSLRSACFSSKVWTDVYMKCLYDSQFVKRIRKAKAKIDFHSITKEMKKVSIPEHKPNKALKAAIIARDLYYLSNTKLQ